MLIGRQITNLCCIVIISITLSYIIIKTNKLIQISNWGPSCDKAESATRVIDGLLTINSKDKDHVVRECLLSRCVAFCVVFVTWYFFWGILSVISFINRLIIVNFGCNSHNSRTLLALGGQIDFENLALRAGQKKAGQTKGWPKLDYRNFKLFDVK